MSIILITTIILILITNTINKSNETAENLAIMNSISYKIDNIFYKTDTTFTNQLSYCSIQQLKTLDLNKTNLNECFLIPDVINNKNYKIANNSNGIYDITYTFNYNKFNNNINNKNKNITDNSDGTITVSKTYNNLKIDLNLLKEVASFIPGTYLTADSLDDNNDTTFYSNVTNKYYSKNNYSVNGNTIKDKNYPDNQPIYVSEYNDDIMYIYDDSNKDITIFSSSGISTTLIEQIEYLLNKLLPKYTVTNSATDDGNGEIKEN